MSKRINIYIRDITHDLLVEYCQMNEFDKSRAVDDLLYGRLAYLKEAKKKAIKEYTKEEQKLLKDFNVYKGDEKAFFEWYKNQPEEKRLRTEWYWSDKNPHSPQNQKEKQENENINITK